MAEKIVSSAVSTPTTVKRPVESFLKWDAGQVSSFIRSILPQEERGLSTHFLDHNIDGSLLPFLTTEHLKELGITSLNSRLVIKKSISDLVVYHYQNHPPKSTGDPEYGLNNVFINSNYVQLESLTLSTLLVKDMVKKLSQKGVSSAVSSAVANQPSPTADIVSPVSPSDKYGTLTGSAGVTPGSASDVDVKKLNDNFLKLKKDLIPVIRLLKDSKPLPTPTLDPGSAANKESPLYSTYRGGESSPVDDPPTSMTAMAPQARPRVQKSGSFNSGIEQPQASPHKVSLSNGGTSQVNNRYSSATLLSMGTGKVVQQSVPKLTETRSSPEFKLQKLPKRSDEVRTSSAPTVAPEPSRRMPQTSHSSGSIPALEGKASASTLTSSKSSGQVPVSKLANEPLKQLRASSDDSCLKILQQAMKRHHIPRDDWSKYVLVICYGNKERILKLAEKPVIIFKELQELGKHPAIMLRQLAVAPEDAAYDDSRIADDIPGGSL
ncbi:hypothetical protein DICA3_C10990 [Diutina catenulata]